MIKNTLIPSSLPAGSVAIYALTNPLTGDVRYVGKSINPYHRYIMHLFNAKNSASEDNWILVLSRSKHKPGWILLETTTIDSWPERERYWISFYRGQGALLTNVTDGGDGALNVPKTAQHREKIAKASAHRWYLRSENGEEQTITNLKKFCRDNGYNSGPFLAVARGDKLTAYGFKCYRVDSEGCPIVVQRERKSNGSPCTDERKQQVKEHFSKDWIVTSPSGETSTVHNLKEFSRKNDLSDACMSLVASGRLKHHRGWKCQKVTSDQTTS